MASDQTKVNKVFLDSSVLIAAAISPKGYASDLITKSFRGELKVIVSDLVIEETQRNGIYIFKASKYIYFAKTLTLSRPYSKMQLI